MYYPEIASPQIYLRVLNLYLSFLFLKFDILQSQSEYWQRTLDGAPALLELPTDRSRPAQQDHSGAFIALEIDEQLTSALKALTRRHGTTLFMTLLTAWTTLLARLSGATDIVIGIPVANRTRAELDPLVGFFVNTLALRIDLTGSPTIAQLLKHVRAQALDAQQHQDLPFEQIVEIIKPLRSLSHSPIFQVMFAWDNIETGDIELPGLTLASIDIPYHIAKFDLTLNFSEAGKRIVGGIEYATSLFDRTTIERYLGYLHNILQAMAENDQQAVDQLDVLRQIERHQLLVEWNVTQVEFPKDKCIHELFEKQANEQPSSIAVVHQDQEHS